ncbi:MAG: elongation factor Ts [Parcubacteria group bacterium CG10_big_fil_rev_8_21_14_0_10_38_31]|nr:MAG: elongation factor Ts [Parcubacteria group bacterium CG10_big_fil_rev_8_21_14_0_10_38_31]
MVTVEKIKELRDKTSVSMMACKKALEETGGDVEKAIIVLRKAGIKVADKKSDRQVDAGIIEAYIHAGGKVGVLVEGRCETDFVSKNEGFKNFLHDIAMHIAALNPTYLNESEIPEIVIDEAKDIFREEIKTLDKPEDMKEKIIEGKVSAYFKERVLLNQSFVKNPDITVNEHIRDAIQKFGENIEISRFVRFSV